jgi:hypothetical protein
MPSPVNRTKRRSGPGESVDASSANTSPTSLAYRIVTVHTKS